MASFEERTKAPAKTNKSFYSNTNPFYPSFVDQCTWYCWGRQLELGVPVEDLKAKLPTSNAENWAHDTKYPVFKYPRVGDIGVYRAGKYHEPGDGPGHVFIVEHVYSDGRILISESGANMKFQTRIVSPPYNYYLKSKYKYTFDGFIHILDFDEKYFVPGCTYRTKFNKYLRTSPEVKAGNKIIWKTLKPEWRAISYADSLGKARFYKGIDRELVDFANDSKGNIWGKCKTENTPVWLCVEDDTGRQVEKV